MLHQAMQLGLKSLINLSSFAARPRKSRIESSVALSVRSMGKRNLSTAAKTALSTVEDEKDKKLKRLKEAGPNLSSADDLGSVTKMASVDIESIKDDPEKIEVMTVEQLKKLLRAVGIPAKGRKSELVSALKHFLNEKHFNGDSSQEAAHALSKSSSGEACPQSVKGGGSEVSGLKQYKRRDKQLAAKNDTAEVNVNMRTENELLITADEVSVVQSSRSRRKISSNVVSENRSGILITMPQAEPWTILAHKKPQKGWIPYNPRTMRPPPPIAGANFVKLMSWNVNGLRALLKLEGFSALELAQRENFDILCLQETKLQEKDVESIKQCLIDGYENSFWTCSRSKLGYSGTAIISRIKPLSVKYGLGIPEHDGEGRVVTLEFDSFYLLSVYVPNSGDGLKRLSYRTTEWDPSLSNYMKELEKSKPVILTGDLNCAHQEIDIYNPAGNRRSAGFTDEERQSFGANFLSKGFVDTFRAQHPNVVGYTYWGFRHGGRKTNRGWRLDYFLVSESVADKVHDSYIVPDVMGSDHCPTGLILEL